MKMLSLMDSAEYYGLHRLSGLYLVDLKERLLQTGIVKLANHKDKIAHHYRNTVPDKLPALLTMSDDYKYMNSTN